MEAVQGGERDAGLPKGHLELVFLCDAYHHFEYPQHRLASLRRALKPGGMLVVVVDYEHIPGVSSPWVMGHVRVGRDEAAREIEATGFRPLDVPDAGLRENWLLRFRRAE